ncbi:oxidoreductase, partial [Enterococcus faecalis]
GKSQLKLTYDSWKHQIILPYPLDDFFGGEYSGDKQALIAGSYILTPERTGFIRTENASEGSPTQNVYYTYTENQGNTWKNVA